MGSLNIIADHNEYFINRVEAGLKLSRELLSYELKNPVVVGIPRGGSVLAWEIAIGLKGDMDVVVCQKLRAPGNPELAVGAVSESGKLFLNDEALLQGADPDEMEKERAFQMKEIAKRVEAYRTLLPKISYYDRPVVLTDDGLATGLTMEAAIWAVKKERPSRMVLAVPAAPRQIIRRLAEQVDETLCLCSVPNFETISQFYLDFSPTTDKEVQEILKAESLKRTASGGAGRKVV